MWKIGAGLGRGSDAVAAARGAAEAALGAADLHRADAALVFATGRCIGEAPALLRAAADTLGTRALVGASAHGVLACGVEAEDEIAVATVVFSGIETQPFLVPELREFEDCVGGEIVSRLGGMPRPEDLVVLLPDPAAFVPGRLLGSLRDTLGEARLVGAAAGGTPPRQSLQWCGPETTRGGLAGLVVRGARPPRVGVTQSCRPVTELFTVTRTRGHWILELDGQPALDVYREVAREPLAADLRRAANVLLVALPVGGAPDLEKGHYVVRNVAGFAEGPRAFAVAQAVKPGARLALALRDGETAREDLKRMLGEIADAEAAMGLYFSCCARGQRLFSVPGLEAAYLHQALDPAPVGGMFGSCEIGPLGTGTELLTYSGVLAVVESDATRSGGTD